MNGKSIEKLLTLMDDNLIYFSEYHQAMLRYVTTHQQEVKSALKRDTTISIPTKDGAIEVNRAALAELLNTYYAKNYSWQ